MNLRRMAAAIGVIAVGTALAYQVTAAARGADEPKASSKSAKGEEAKDTARYAQAQFRLAELTLRRAEEFNRKVPRTLSAAVIAQFKDDVDFARLQLERIGRTGTIDAYQDLITRTELEVRAAEAKLKAGQHANQVAQGSLSELDIERLKLNVEVAKFQMDRGRALASATPAEKLQWELEMLSASMNKLRGQVMIISQNRLSEF